MNEKEDYFRITKRGDKIHILNDRIPLNWTEILFIPSSTFIIAYILFGYLIIGTLIGIITLIGYIIYRFGAWFYYSEILIDEETGKMTLSKKILKKVHRSNLITDKFDPTRFEYTKLTRSGKNKYLLTYRTYKDFDLLILKNESDKNEFENYVLNKIKI